MFIVYACTIVIFGQKHNYLYVSLYGNPPRFIVS